MTVKKHRVLWADDEIELLKPHIRFLEGKGFEVVAVVSGEDALARVKEGPFDAVLLDEMMPGMGGLATLQAIKEIDPTVPIVLVTKSEEESLMQEAIGRRIDDYLVKPVHPSQVLLTLLRLVKGEEIQRGQFTRDYVGEFNRLQQRRLDPMNQNEWLDVYRRVTELELELFSIEDFGLRQAHLDMKREMNRDFARFVEREYPEWLAGGSARPPLSVDIIPRQVVPRLGGDRPVYLLVLDCMRYDQWLALKPLLDPLYRVDMELYYSIIPSATPYSRNAMFSGFLPRDMAKRFPQWWREKSEEGKGKNRFEDELLGDHLRRLVKRDVKFKYMKVASEEEEQSLRREIGTYGGIPLVVFVFNFLDQLSHGRSESRVIRELAPDEAAFRSLLVTWFVHSGLGEVLRKIAEQGATVILTSDHGAIQVKHSTLVYGDRETSTSLRYKFGSNLRGEDKDVILIRTPETWGLPADAFNKNYMVAREDKYFVYPTNFHEYERLYRNTFQHGGVSMEEVILPCVTLTPR